jgi:hypothetical protein
MEDIGQVVHPRTHSADSTGDDHQVPWVSQPTRRDRFFAGYLWLALRNVLGWLLILAAFVAGPLVPGPGGIPLFLIGFALISFPGKRRLTARVLRGKPVRFRQAPLAFVNIGVALVVPALVLPIAKSRSSWLDQLYADMSARAQVAVAALYLIIAALVWLLVRLLPRVLNLLLRITAKASRKSRPWLRRHHVRLLPPRWRRRHVHEPGRGPLRLKQEILKFSRKRRQHG